MLGDDGLEGGVLAIQRLGPQVDVARELVLQWSLDVLAREQVEHSIVVDVLLVSGGGADLGQVKYSVSAALLAHHSGSLADGTKRRGRSLEERRLGGNVLCEGLGRHAGPNRALAAVDGDGLLPATRH